MFFLDILREKYNFKLIKGRHLDYSTMIPNGIYGEYSNGETSIFWGLSEFKKPPTLITPRPKVIKTVDDKIMTEINDNIINECLLKFNHEDIVNAILNPKLNIRFNLDINTIERI